ncbi:hypothetical protein RRG08_048579 [Elysia crispata]|uniref:Secreted protein n=1 Tax=Elysia crispata TaxID=231223 RepID=A0AAE1B6Q3_9GAST|nr:hypothetical protein RRG08_048579 [Elysia crispata]
MQRDRRGLGYLVICQLIISRLASSRQPWQASDAPSSPQTRSRCDTRGKNLVGKINSGISRSPPGKITEDLDWFQGPLCFCKLTPEGHMGHTAASLSASHFYALLLFFSIQLRPSDV